MILIINFSPKSYLYTYRKRLSIIIIECFSQLVININIFDWCKSRDYEMLEFPSLNQTVIPCYPTLTQDSVLSPKRDGNIIINRGFGGFLRNDALWT